jgi:lipid A 3-O-deacylase
MPRSPFAALLAALPLLFAAAPASAGSWGIELDNDRFVETDRHFTHGTRLFWLGDADETPDWAFRLADDLPRLDGPGTLRIGAAIGQNMYTPDDITDPDVILDDRPYAGWLYGALALARTHDGNRRALELDIGIVGPASLARQTQIIVHEFVQTRTPRGWSHQLRNEPGVMLVYEEMWQHAWDLPVPGVRFGAIPHAAASVGNVYTYAAAGGTLRIGDFADDDFGPARIRPGVPGGDGVGDVSGGFDWYVFAGAEGRYVAHNIFLDGNTFTDSHSVDRRPFVLDIQLGATLTLPAARLTVMHVFRTREFERQSAADRFGVVQAAFRF